MQLPFSKLAQQRAFSLIELMIVVAIVATLAAILVPNFLHARSESLTAACEANEKQLATAEEEYATDNWGRFIAFASLTTPYLSHVVSDPVKKNNKYTITIPGTGTSGAFLITDAGGHDTTTTKQLTKTNGAVCKTCASIVYAQSSGIHGK